MSKRGIEAVALEAGVSIGTVSKAFSRNRALAGRADRVVEVVCGLPVVWKGEGL